MTSGGMNLLGSPVSYKKVYHFLMTSGSMNLLG